MAHNRVLVPLYGARQSAQNIIKIREQKVKSSPSQFHEKSQAEAPTLPEQRRHCNG